MKTKKFRFLQVVRFRRWQNKPYSVFNTLKKVVVIAVLPLAYVAFSFSNLNAQIDSVTLSEIVINSNRISLYNEQTAKIVEIINQSQLASNSYWAFTDIFTNLAGVDVIKRAPFGIQGDMSLRGGTFDQTLLLLNGLPFIDKQTGHNSLSFNLPVNLIERIEFINGPATSIFGNGAYNGAINIITSRSKLKSLSLSYGQFNSLVLSGIFNTSKISVAANLEHSDGYTTNTDFDNLSFYFRYNLGKFSFLQILTSIKNFGALNFYTPKFPYQYEKIRKVFVQTSLALDNQKKNILNFYLNVGYDNFQLFREDPHWWIYKNGYFIRNSTDTAAFAPKYYYRKHNYHITTTIGGSFTRKIESLLGISYAGVSIEFDTIVSNVLGNKRDTLRLNDRIFFTKGAKRLVFNTFVNHIARISFINLILGANYVYNDVFKSHFSFNAEMTANLTKYIRPFLSFSQGIRYPTFTDLYYSGPNNQGNPNLLPEKSTNYELGLKSYIGKVFSQASGFYQIGNNTIDWVKKNETDLLWTTMNYTIVNTFGATFSSDVSINRFFKTARLSYTYLHQRVTKQEFISKYAANYLKHNLVVNFVLQPIKNLTVALNYRYMIRNGFYFVRNELNQDIQKSFEPVDLVDMNVLYSYKFLEFSFSISNIFNKKYYDLSYIELPGRWIMASVSLNF